MSAVFVFDRMRVRPGRLDEVRERLRAEYLPGAVRRGMQLLGSWVDPVAHPERARDLFVLWRLEDVAAFWSMRGASGRDASVRRWWTEADALLEERERRFLSEAELDG